MSELTLTVLGKSPAWQDAHGACSAYLVDRPGTRLLIDCGNGAMGKISAYTDPFSIDAVLISHLHADHCFDLVPLAYALAYCPRPDTSAGKRPRLFLPEGGTAALCNVASMWGDTSMFENVFEVIEYTPHASLTIGEVTIQLAPVPHLIPTVAADIRHQNGARFTYGADCGPNAELIELAAGTPLLIAEATIPQGEIGSKPTHMSARQAGSLAQAARAEHLMLTHYSELYDPQWMRDEAGVDYGGEVHLAAEGLRFGFSADNMQVLTAAED